MCFGDLKFRLIPPFLSSFACFVWQARCFEYSMHLYGYIAYSRGVWQGGLRLRKCLGSIESDFAKTTRSACLRSLKL